MGFDLMQNIQIWMIRKGKTKKDLSEHLQLAPSTVSKYFSGDLRLSSDKLRQIADFLGVSMEEFFKEPERNKTSVPGSLDEFQKIVLKQLEVLTEQIEELQIKVNLIQTNYTRFEKEANEIGINSAKMIRNLKEQNKLLRDMIKDPGNDSSPFNPDKIK